jgi:hypothetical protein
MGYRQSLNRKISRSLLQKVQDFEKSRSGENGEVSRSPTENIKTPDGEQFVLDKLFHHKNWDENILRQIMEFECPLVMIPKKFSSEEITLKLDI